LSGLCLSREVHIRNIDRLGPVDPLVHLWSAHHYLKFRLQSLLLNMSQDECVIGRPGLQSSCPLEGKGPILTPGEEINPTVMKHSSRVSWLE